MHEGRYSKQINRVIDYISSNLGSDLSVGKLSELANLSPYHFHRIFTLQVGEPMAKHILRIRLERAAILLQADPTKSVTEISCMVGFNSMNVFCRNFRKWFGVTAEEYRRKNSPADSKKSTLKRNISPDERVYSHYFCSHKTFKTGDKTMDCTFEIKKLPTLHVVYCRHHGAYDGIQEAFARLMQWAWPRGLVTAPGAKLLSVYRDNPEITAPDKLISDACLTVGEPIKTDGEVGSYDLDGGLYAVGRFEIGMEEFPEAWQCMYKLVAEHGCYGTGIPFELYHNNRDEHPEKKWIAELCIPVAAR